MLWLNLPKKTQNKQKLLTNCWKDEELEKQGMNKNERNREHKSILFF